MASRLFFFLFSVVVFTNISFSQEEDEDCMLEDKKVLKLIEKAKSPKIAAYSGMKERFTFLADAAEILPENAVIRYEFARMMMKDADYLYEKYPNPNRSFGTYNKAAELFKQVIEKCPSYRPDAYYSVGYIYFIQGRKADAAIWFEAFLDYDNKFPNEDAEKYPNGYRKLRDDVAEILPELRSKETLLADVKPFDPKLVQNVSTPRSEYLPMISPDNELIFYTRKVNSNTGAAISSKVSEQFTVSQRANIKVLFDGGTPLVAPFNTGEYSNYGGVTVSVDNKEMIICACKEIDYEGMAYRNCDLFKTTWMRTGAGGNDYVWTELKNLGPNINGRESWEAQPTLSADGNTLYFTKLSGKTYQEDIYYSKRGEDGNWGRAVPFTAINTVGRDKAPFLHQDSQTMYFASDTDPDCDGCRLGVGGLDIFYTRLSDDGSWSTPKNIGYPINTEGDDIGLFVSTDGHYAYFSSTNENTTHDIYRFELYEEARPEKVMIVKGELKDDEGKPVENATIEISYSNNEEVTKVKVNGNDGKYAAVVKIKDESDVMVTVKKEGSAFDSKLFKKEELEKMEKKLVTKGINLEVKKLEVGKAFTINDILYATASYELTNNSMFILKGFSRFLKENPAIKITIQGHTDDTGNDKTNLKLSENRANGVKNYLISLGIEKDRLKSEGYGETKPKVKNDSEPNRAINRRTEFVIDEM